ncbi:MAG TPA: bifunctional DNA-formamidopyrimidine glycosylase/DNA-(apurinic or apyrimidinic site) lyase [Acidimicrobiales bacterium]|nr:bifunctional DNA-formamidopyrimidine glycosylase/DNA-(apurinic or apyrimidinic site) lyase [Acidimicrobiales bacterium]
MPELAEVETIRRGVEAVFVGRLVESAEVTGARSVRRHPPSRLAEVAVGRRLVAAGRRGKYLLLHLEGGDVVVAHMGMSGQMLRAPADSLRLPHTQVTLGFSGGDDLRFVDPRTFGQMFATTAELPELAHLGFDPIAEPIGAADLARRLAGRRTRLKALLMDQRFVAGIGNIYSDEILFAARLGPARPASSLTPAEARRLHRAIGGVLSAAIELRGSSLPDSRYRDLYGETGSYQYRHAVYGRAGRACPRCRSEIARVRYGGRSGFFCPRCQT